jgi:histidine triad (HIT) family protein
MTYDSNNIFARILRGEIPNRTVMDTGHTLAFHDINPLAPVHVLVIPKGAYVTFADFAAQGSEAEIADFHRVCAKIIAMMDLAQGYRADGGQEVPHYHLHILGGRALGPMLMR